MVERGKAYRSTGFIMALVASCIFLTTGCASGAKNEVIVMPERIDEEIAAVGLAHWIHRSWKLFSFKIREIYQPEQGSLPEAFRSLREAGGKAWDKIPDPEAYLREVRT